MGHPGPRLGDPPGAPFKQSFKNQSILLKNQHSYFQESSFLSSIVSRIKLPLKQTFKNQASFNLYFQETTSIKHIFKNQASLQAKFQESSFHASRLSRNKFPLIYIFKIFKNQASYFQESSSFKAYFQESTSFKHIIFKNQASLQE